MMKTATQITHRPRKPAPRPAGGSVDPRVAAFQRRLRETQLGRDVLRLVDRLAEARIIEQLISIGLDSAERAETTTHERLRGADARQTAESIGEAEALRVELFEAERESRRWRGALLRGRRDRELIEAELQLAARAL
jgi:hypothetical protein